MKKIVAISGICLLGLVGCKKEGNTSVIKENIETKVTNDGGIIDTTTTTSIEQTVNGKKIGTNSYTYKGLDGTRAKITFTNTEKSSTLIIQANKNKYELDKKSDNIYERNTVKAEIKGDSVIITQDDNVIPLVLDK